MKKFCTLLLSGAVIALSAAKITVKADKDYASCGEEITFTIRCTGEDAPAGKFFVSLNGSEALRKLKVTPVYAADGSAVVKVNVEENPELAARHNITTLPTLIVYRNGQETGRYGLLSKSRIVSLFQ